MDGLDFRVFVPFSKVSTQPDGTLLVESIINDETVDDQDEIIDYDAVKRASADYMAWANVREMHMEKAAGTMIALEHDDERRRTRGVLRIVDPGAVQKVMTGVYKGTSMGGRKRARVMQKMAGGKRVGRIVDLTWIETSLVDRPSRPTATLTILKRADLPEPDGFFTEDGRITHESELHKIAWLPSGMAEGDLDDGDFAWLSDAYRAGKESASAGRKLPFKVHGKVNERGWRAAWNRANQSSTDFSGGPSQSAVLSRLKRAKPEGITLGDDITKAATAADETAPETTEAPGDGETTTDAPEEAPAKDDTTEAAPEGTEDDAPVEKSASSADDLVTAGSIVASLAYLIQCEASEGESDQVAPLKQALALVQKYASMEAGELDSPANLTAIAQMDQPMAYAAEIGDLRKIVMTLTEEVVALRKASTPTDLPAAEIMETEPIDQERIAAYLIERLTDSPPFAKMAAAVKADLLEALTPMQEQIAKIAAQPTSGGPLRYAPDPRRFLEDAPEARESMADALAKVAAQASDPGVREELGRMAAAEQIRSLQMQRT